MDAFNIEQIGYLGHEIFESDDEAAYEDDEEDDEMKDERRSVVNEFVLLVKSSPFQNDLNEGIGDNFQTKQGTDRKRDRLKQDTYDDNRNDKKGLVVLDEEQQVKEEGASIPTEIVIVIKRKASIPSTAEVLDKQIEAIQGRLTLFMQKSQESRKQLDRHGLNTKDSLSLPPLSSATPIAHSRSQF
jgi:hypothetical protein